MLSSWKKLLVVLTTLFVLRVTSEEECQPIKVKNGLNLLNCSGKGFSKLPDLEDSAEVLDFSNNNFLQFPYLSESKECNENCHVINESKIHCRYDVSFSRNEIFTFHDRALHSLRCLRTLDLSYNDIKSSVLEAKTFQEGTYRLENLILRGNPLGSLPDNAIVDPFTHHIRYIDLSHCELEAVGENSLDDLSELTTLNLSYNKLKEIKKGTFKGLRNLRILDLSHNELQSLGHQVFGDLTNLDSLILTDNKIVSFARHAFYQDSKLKNLDLTLNNLESVPYQALQELTKMKHLILSYNPLTSVKNPDSSIVLSSVQTLEIEGMGALTKLGKKALASFPSLVTLSIRNNRNLQYIHPKFLATDTTTLREVHMDSNGLTTLSEDALPWQQLTTIVLKDNPWQCDYRIQWMVHSKAVRSNTIICDGPIQLKGRDIKTIHPYHLQRPFTVAYILAIIVLAICLPAIIISVYVVWKRREHIHCCKPIQGRYVSVYTRDVDSENDDRVDIQVKINHLRLKGVSNGDADDTQPFITMESPPATEDKEPEDKDL